jgi:hypothetical protein
MKTGRQQIASAFAFVAFALTVALAACSSNSSKGSAGNDGVDSGDDGSGGCTYGGCPSSSGGNVDAGQVIIGASGGTGIGASSVNDCPGVTDGTVITGRVVDPAGKNPLFNIVVENPASDPIDLTMVHQGASCAACSSLYTTALAYTYTDETGHFTLKHAASDNAGKPTAIIAQIGKWRTVIQTNIKSCQANNVGDIKLPSKVTAGDFSSIPQIAISTGSADSLECLFHRMGIADSEYVGGSGSGHIHIYTATNSGGPGASVTGGSPAPEQQLWDTQAHLAQYDIVLFSCEGAETNQLTDTGRTNLFNYANNGGRAFMSHYHYSWFTPTGPFSTLSPAMATWQTGFIQDNDPIGGVISTTTATGKPFPEGVSMGKWLTNLGATQNGKLYPIHYSRDNATVSAANKNTQMWIAADNSSMNPGNAQYLSTDTGSGDNVCGRVVYSDLHVSGGPNNTSDVNTDYPGFASGICPSGCATHDLTAQEKALEFMIFDLSSCLVKIGGDAGVPDIPM